MTGNDTYRGLFFLVDLPNGGVDTADESFIPIIAQNDMANAVVYE